MFVDDIKLYKIFEGLDTNECSEILKIGQKKTLPQGEYLFREDSPGDRIYLLYEGKVEITINNPIKPNEEIVLAEINQRDAIGEFALFDNAPRSANAKAATPLTFWAIHTEDLFDKFEENNRIGMVSLRNLGKILASRLRNADIQLRNSLLWTATQSDSP